MRVLSALAGLLVASSVAVAQPADPYQPPAEDPVLAEQVAQSLVARAQELFDARVFVDAKQLAVEAVVKSPKGPASTQARLIIAQVNRQLGIADAPPPGTAIAPPSGPPLDTPPSLSVPPSGPAISAPPVDRPADHARIAATVHGALYGGVIGATIGAAFSKASPAKGVVPGGLALGIAGGLFAPRVADKLRFDEAQIRTAGAGSVWGGVIGGLVADAVGVDTSNTRTVLLGASIGASVGLVGGGVFAKRHRLTRGDVALVDTLAGIGTFGGFTIGMVMQPPKSEAYSVNAILGAAGGVVVGLLAAPDSNTTQRRMLRVAGLAAAGGGLPFVLYAGIHDSTTTSDEQTVGILSTAGLVLGAYIGFKLTAGMDAGLDTLDGKRHADVDDAPVSLLQHHSDGRWALGTVAVQPLSLLLAPQPGLTVPLVGAAY